MKKTLLLIWALLTLLIIASCNPEAKCVHTWGEWTESKSATCTEDGLEIRKCTICGVQDEETQVIKALGHLLSESGIVVNEATCGTEGEETYLCTRDNCDYKETKVLSATGEHKYGDWITDADSTEEKEGKRHRICSVCNYNDEEIIPLKEHTCITSNNYGYDEISHWKKCIKKTCPKKLESATHTFTETITKNATCFEKGSKTVKCFVCGYEDTEEIPTTDHNYSAEGEVTTEATCTTDGVKTFRCTTTGCTATRMETIPAKGHTLGGYKTELETCTKSGSVSNICSICGQEYDISIIEATGHSWGAWRTDIAGTCTTHALYIRSCTNRDCTALQSDYSKYGNHPDGKLVWKAGEAISFLTKAEKREYCTECNSYTENKKDDYDSVEGYWISNEYTKTDNGVAYECYFSIDMDDTRNAVIEKVVKESDGKIKDIDCIEYTYTWGFDESNPTVRTTFILTTAGENDSITLQYSITENNNNGTLMLTSGNDSFTLTRKSTEHHTEHTYEEAEKKDENYHIIKTNCGEEFHEVIYKEESHKFDNNKTCIFCGYAQPYELPTKIYFDEPNEKKQYDPPKVQNLKVERNEPFYPRGSYTFKDVDGNDLDIIGITKWVTINKDGEKVSYGISISNDNPIKLEDDMSLEVHYTYSSWIER